MPDRDEVRAIDRDEVRAIVTAATLAPSVHNTQPWRFVSAPDRVELWADPTRALPVLDPDGRARHLSCGAALVYARICAAGLGRSTRIVLLPDPGDPDHLADLHLRPAPRPDAAEQALAAAIGVRHTERGAFRSYAPVPPDLIRSLSDAAAAEECWLRVVDTADDAASVAVLLARADEVQSRDPAYREELRRWTGRDPDSADGIPATAVPDTAPAQRGSNFRLRDFDADRHAEDPGTEHPDWSADPPVAEHPLVVVLGTADDDPGSWLRAGQGLGRVLLAATVGGLVASPMSQAMEVTDTRARLGRELGVVGHPQVVLRVGLAPAGPPPTAGHANRRPVDDVLTFG